MTMIHASAKFAFMTKDKKEYYQNNGSVTKHVMSAACFDKMAIDDLKSFLSFYDIDRDDVVLVSIEIVVNEEDLPF